VEKQPAMLKQSDGAFRPRRLHFLHNLGIEASAYQSICQT